MIKQFTALVGLIIVSVSVNAAIIDLGTVTRDTSTGLDWLDLTETNYRSYNYISSKLGDGQEFGGWRYATVAEVQVLWANMGVPNGLTERLIVGSDEYGKFVDAVGLLGNTAYEHDAGLFDYGVVGLTGEVNSEGRPYSGGIYHEIDNTGTTGDVWDPTVITEYPDLPYVYLGSYLVTTVPIPAAGYLFMSALAGLIVRKRIARK